MKSIVARVHLWAGLVLGVQVLIWMTSGVVMSWFHITTVRGDHQMAEIERGALDLGANYAPLSALVLSNGAPAIGSVSLQMNGAKPIYYVTDDAGDTRLFDAVTGQSLSPIDADQARAAALADFSGRGEIVALELLAQTPQEYRKDLPVWRAQFDDTLQTRLYISHDTGDVVSRRNAVWRLYDFFWMLHIMDYGEREDFNNPLIRAASATGFLFALSGLFLVFFRIRAGRYRNDLELAGRKLKSREAGS